MEYLTVRETAVPAADCGGVSLNNAYRWFLGYSLQEETPHFSSVSYNFRHDSVAFDAVYDRVTAAFPEAEAIVADSAYKTLISARGI